MAFRFVHTADLHLDSPLRSLALRTPDLADLIGTASRESLAKTVDLCLEERVDALLIAGDLYDGEQTSMKTARFLADQMKRLHDGNVKTFVIRGNHDALSKITRQLSLPDSVHVFDGRGGMVSIENDASALSVHIHGLSFKEPKAPTSLLSLYHKAIPDAVNIGIMHTSLNGSPHHDVYAPCSESELQGTGFDYWALGHIHSRCVIEGRTTIVMAGMTQGRDIGEAGAKSVSLVTMTDGKLIKVEEKFVSPTEFQPISIDLSGLDEWQDVLRAIESGLDVARGQAVSETLIGRLRLTGSTVLAPRLRWDKQVLAEETSRAAEQMRQTFVDKVELDVSEPAEASKGDGGPLPDLRQIVSNDVLKADSFQQDLLRIAEELKRELPPECGSYLKGDPAEVAKLLQTLAREGVEDVLARLQQSPVQGNS